jgi:putative ABC transport system permease protein
LNKVAGDTTLQPNGILMAEDAAKSRNVKPGDTLEVTFPRSGKQTLTVGGTYEANELIGEYVIDESQAKGFTSTVNVVALVNIEDGADSAAVRSALEQQVAAYPNVDVQDQSEFVDQVAGQVNQIVTIINILLGLSVLIALLGVLNTLALSVIERTRELGLLRAVGMARRQVKRMIRVEAVVICTFGGLLGLAVGAVFGVALQKGLEDDGVTELAFPVVSLLLFLIGASIAGVVAAWLPARRASRLNVLAAIATE